MSRRPLLVAPLVAFSLIAAGCGVRSEPTGALPAPFPVTVEGAADAPVTVERPPERIVALDVGAAELIETLGRSSSLVGVPAGAVPSDAGDAEEVVRPTGQIDVDAVARLAPDLIVAAADTDRVDLAQVEQRSEATVYVLPSRSIEDVERGAIELGFLLGEPVRARQLAGKLKRAVARIEARLADVEPVTVFADTGFFITVPETSLLGDLIEKAHGTRIGGETAALGPFPVRKLVAADPEVYLATSDSRTTLDSLRRNPSTNALTAVREGRFTVLPVELVMHAGPNVARALEAVAVALHPDAFR